MIPWKQIKNKGGEQPHRSWTKLTQVLTVVGAAFRVADSCTNVMSPTSTFFYMIFDTAKETFKADDDDCSVAKRMSCLREFNMEDSNTVSCGRSSLRTWPILRRIGRLLAPFWKSLRQKKKEWRRFHRKALSFGMAL